MGGKILEYEAKTILNEGWREALAKGQILVFTNLIKRGFSVEGAMSIAEITREQADRAIAAMSETEQVTRDSCVKHYSHGKSCHEHSHPV